MNLYFRMLSLFVCVYILTSRGHVLVQVMRLESQVKRFKGSADESEKTIEEMKLDKRKLQRDVSCIQMLCF